MSLFDYKASLMISKEDPPFYALIMAAMRKADTSNVKLLRSIYPDTWKELEKRYHFPDGRLEGEKEQIL